MKSQRGSTLMIVIIAMGVMSVLVAVTLAIVQNMTGSVAYAEATLEANNQIYLAKTFLADPGVCIANFNTVILAGKEVVVTGKYKNKNLKGEDLFPIRDGLKAKAVTFKLEIVKADSPLVANLQIVFDRKFGTSIVRSFPLSFIIDGSGLITSCTAGDPETILPRKPASAAASCDDWVNDVQKLDPQTPLMSAFNTIKQRIEMICDRLSYPTGRFPDAPQCPSDKTPDGSVINTSCTVHSGGNSGVGWTPGYHLVPSKYGYDGSKLGTAFSNLKSKEECKANVSTFPDGGSWKWKTTGVDPDGAAEGVTISCRDGVPGMAGSYTSGSTPWWVQ